MFRLASCALSFALSIAVAGCLVGDPDALRRGNNANVDAGTGGGSAPDAARGGGGGIDAAPGTPDASPVPTPATVLRDFGQCMLLADWDAANLGAVALVVTQADGNCAACHSAGLGGAYLSLDNAATFGASKAAPYILRYAKADALLNITVSDDLIVKGQDPGHPAYVLPADLAQGVTQFFDATNARYIAGACPPAQ